MFPLISNFINSHDFVNSTFYMVCNAQKSDLSDLLFFPVMI